MTIYVGGLRLRLIRDNMANMIRQGLDDLGWFDSGRAHRTVTMIFDPVDYQTEILPNTVAICDEGVESFEDEMGSNFSEHRWTFYIDVYAESSAVGIHLSEDIKAIIEGRMPSIGRTGPNFSVYDLTQATPPHLFYCEFEDISIGRGRVYDKPWERFWYSINFDVIDYYGNEDDDS